MKNRITLFFILFLILFLQINSAFAEQQTLGYVKTNTCIILKQSYANSTWQNITAVTQPDKKTISIINSGMTSLGQGLFNYSYCIGTQSGQYIVDGIGDKDGTAETWTYDFSATTLGISNSYIFYFIFFSIIIFIFAVGFKLENPYVMFLGSILVLILGFFIVINGIDQIKDVNTTWAIGLVTWALGIYFIYLSVEEQLKQWG